MVLIAWGFSVPKYCLRLHFLPLYTKLLMAEFLILPLLPRQPQLPLLPILPLAQLPIFCHRLHDTNSVCSTDDKDQKETRLLEKIFLLELIYTVRRQYKMVSRDETKESAHVARKGMCGKGVLHQSLHGPSCKQRFVFVPIRSSAGSPWKALPHWPGWKRLLRVYCGW